MAIGFTKRLQLAEEYVKGDASYRELAAKYGMTKGQINWIGSSYGWAIARAAYREKAMRDAITPESIDSDQE
jgi:hypothetical protein